MFRLQNGMDRENLYETEWYVQLSWLNLKIETNIQKTFFINLQQ